MSEEIKKDPEVKEEACCCEAEKKADDAEKKECCCEAEKKADGAEKKECCCGAKKSNCRMVILLIILLALAGVLGYKVQKYRYEQTYQKSVEDKIIAVIGSNLPADYKVSTKFEEKEAVYHVYVAGKRKIDFAMICVYEFGPKKFGPQVQIANKVDSQLWDRFLNAIEREKLAVVEVEKAAVSAAEEAKNDVKKATEEKVQQVKSDLQTGAKKVEEKVQEQAKEADKAIQKSLNNVRSDAKKAQDNIQKNVIDKVQLPAGK